MDEPTLDIGWVPDGFTLADPPGLHITEAVVVQAVIGSDEQPDPPVTRNWSRHALYLAPLPVGTVADRPYRRISLSWYVLDALGPRADRMLVGVDECRSYPSADGSGTVYVRAGLGRYVDDTYLVAVSFDDDIPEGDIRRMLTTVRITGASPEAGDEGRA